ncbi:hypothetical protein BJ508DRAFT_312074 [Ascobolus immersus RN42]|uniref:Uncharacterized protein n=1 Tax=Ascobolus immersus RN42 TaxID=1160509 RepID=A0A3N4HNC1_ASCIM|nr:hypothetical protein BJ508DRAFT_312074 [Ascobolus immersus RN42]
MAPLIKKDIRKMTDEEAHARLRNIIKNLNRLHNNRILDRIERLTVYIKSILELELEFQAEAAQESGADDSLGLTAYIYATIDTEINRSLYLIRASAWRDPRRDPPDFGFKIIGIDEHAEENRKWLIEMVFPKIEGLMQMVILHDAGYRPFLERTRTEDLDENNIEHEVFGAICGMVQELVRVFEEVVAARVPFERFKEESEAIWREVSESSEAMAVHEKGLAVFGESPWTYSVYTLEELAAENLRHAE